jgi:hypothetical protein
MGILPPLPPRGHSSGVAPSSRILTTLRFGLRSLSSILARGSEHYYDSCWVKRGKWFARQGNSSKINITESHGRGESVRDPQPPLTDNECWGAFELECLEINTE